MSRTKYDPKTLAGEQSPIRGCTEQNEIGARDQASFDHDRTLALHVRVELLELLCSEALEALRLSADCIPNRVDSKKFRIAKASARNSIAAIEKLGLR